MITVVVGLIIIIIIIISIILIIIITCKAAGGATEFAVTRKEGKCAALSINYDLIVIALETSGPLSTKTSIFFLQCELHGSSPYHRH